jgi:hypothetical protein
MSRQANATSSLAALYPQIAAQWHPTRNVSLLASQVTPGSGRKVWWKCRKGPDHEWQAIVADRRRFGCPFCAGKKACRATSLATRMPGLARQWHATRNAPLTPHDVTLSSNRSVWWCCARDAEHQWQAPVARRAMRRAGCPFCAGRRASSRNSLAAVAPAAARQLHPTKNGPLRAEDLAAGSDRMVWWKCPRGRDHEWQTRVRKRAVLGRGCPFCGGARTSLQTSLQVRAPRFAAEWHPTRNGSLTPRDVGVGSRYRVWWRCRRRPQHQWEAMVKVRVRSKLPCPFCAGTRASPETSLAARRPTLARQWHPTRNDKLTARDVLPGAARTVWWRCRKGPDHEWRAPIYERARRNPGCPFCAGRRFSVTNSLAARAPALAACWHPAKNGRRTPATVRWGDRRPAWWRCPKGPDHEWRRSPRAQRRYGCPFCSKHRVSVTNCLATRYPKIAACWHPTRNGAITPREVIAGATRRYWWRCDQGHEWRAAPGVRIKKQGGCPFCPRRRRRQAMTWKAPRVRVYLPSDLT